MSLDSPLKLIDITDSYGADTLTNPAQLVQFPLSDEDKTLIHKMKSALIEYNAAGFAAPQFGYRKAVIVFHVPERALQWRNDVKELVPVTVLLNPSYRGVEDRGKTLDWEGCFSVKNERGKVYRYTVIHYEGQNEHGEWISNTAEGYLARLLQHEIDHCHGQLCHELYDPSSPHGLEADMWTLRLQELEKTKGKAAVQELLAELKAESSRKS
jgi:peptide deformylase